MTEALNHEPEGPVEFIADVLAHASEQQREVQAESDLSAKMSAMAEQPPADLEFVLDSLDEVGASHGYDVDELRLLKRDVVIARLASRRRLRR